MSKFLIFLYHFLVINLLLNEINSANRLKENFRINENRFKIDSINDEMETLKDNIEEEIDLKETREKFNNDKKDFNDLNFFNKNTVIINDNENYLEKVETDSSERKQERNENLKIEMSNRNSKKRHNEFGKRKESDDDDYDDYNETDNKNKNETIVNNRDDDESEFNEGPKDVNHNEKEIVNNKNIFRKDVFIKNDNKKDIDESGYDDPDELNNKKENKNYHDVDESDFSDGPKEKGSVEKISKRKENDDGDYDDYNETDNKNKNDTIVNNRDDDEFEFNDGPKQANHNEEEIVNNRHNFTKDDSGYDDPDESKNRKQSNTVASNQDIDETDFNDGPKEFHNNKMEKLNDLHVSKSISSMKIKKRNSRTISSLNNFIRKFKRGLIIGGVNAHIGEYPWAVFLTGELEVGRPLYCGATIISTNWMLSAAHCFLSLDYDELFNLTDPSKWSIQAGNVFVDIPGNDRMKRSTETFDVLEIILHPLYNSEKLEYDIALIKIRNDFKLNIYKKKIDILNEEKINGTVWPKPAQNCIFIGWGCTRPHGLVSERAQKVILPVINHNQCSTTYMGIYDKINPKHEFCAGYYDSDIGICSGDSGSGLVCIYNKKFYLAGIASGTSGARPGRYPAIFTRVSYFYNWIKSTIEQ